MLSRGSSGTLETLTLAKALLLLNELKTSDAEAVVAEHVRVLLEDAQRLQRDIESGYTSLLRTMLDATAMRIAGRDPVLEKQIRMVVLRLTPPLSVTELRALREYVNIIAKRVVAVERVTSFDLPPAIPPISGIHDGPAPRSPPATPAPAAAQQPASDRHAREQLNQKNQEISKIRATLARHVDEAIAQNEEFGVLLGVELDALREAERIQDVEKRRVTLINEINKFVKKHRHLSDKFDSASKYLKLVESSNQQLSDELDRVRVLSLTDELTGLPNRRAFLRRLEDEVGRVKRYNTPVSMTIIDLDGFKAINDLRGHGGGDAVLRAYAENVLSVFRHHDMVARYGGEEFAVILPNTNCDGALRALQKVQQRVAESVCSYNDESFPMPTFSAGLADYRHGETLSDFIERADTALYRAKRRGRNCIEVARDNGDALAKPGRVEDLGARQA
jgi:diguanylate cyclase (GGDEF)-like protein